MKKMIGIVLAMLACIAGAYADSYTYTSDAFSTATQWAVSDALPVAGQLDRVILWNTDPKGTAVVVVATYAGSVQADIICTAKVNNVASAPIVIRTRRVGTASSGTALAYATSAEGITNITQILSVPYEKIMLGGNTKVWAIDAGTTTVTNFVNVQFIYSK